MRRRAMFIAMLSSLVPWSFGVAADDSDRPAALNDAVVARRENRTTLPAQPLTDPAP